MTSIVVWSKENCQFCQKAITLLNNYNIPFEVRKIGEGWTREQLLEAVPNARTVPQILINDDLIGGYDDLTSYIENTNFNGSGHTL